MNSVEKMFDTINSVNRYLYEKSDLTIIEYYYFELTSYAVSLIHESKLGNDNSIAINSVYKSIIEVLSILSICDKSFEKIHLYNKFMEKNLYDKYKNEISLDFFHYKDIKEIELDLDKIYNELPFLKNDYDFTNLINDKYPELIYYYKLCKNNKLGIESIKLDALLLTIIYILCKTKYPNIKIEYKYTLNYEKSFFINHPLSQRYLIYAKNEANELKNYSPYFKELGKIILSISCDKVYLNTEVLETKFLSTINYLTKVYNDLFKANIDEYMLIDLVGYNNSYIKLIYDESLYLSHKSGYLQHSYIDVYQEYSEVIAFIDNAILKILELSKLDYEKLKEIIEEKNRFDFENQYLV